MHLGSAEHGSCRGTGTLGSGCHRIPGLARAAACQAGGDRAANVGLSFIFIKKHVFGVYQGKTNYVY